MSDAARGKHVLIIDRQPLWRDRAAVALDGRGFLVRALADYNYTRETAYFKDTPPDLVLLGCSSIKHEERELINKVLEDRRHLIVLCASLPWNDMRAVFLAGADDVDDKPYDSERLVGIVEDAFVEMESR